MEVSVSREGYALECQPQQTMVCATIVASAKDDDQFGEHTSLGHTNSSLDHSGRTPLSQEVDHRAFWVS